MSGASPTILLDLGVYPQVSYSNYWKRVCDELYISKRIGLERFQKADVIVNP